LSKDVRITSPFRIHSTNGFNTSQTILYIVPNGTSVYSDQTFYQYIVPTGQSQRDRI
jgi:hypothetical protein